MITSVVLNDSTNVMDGSIVNNTVNTGVNIGVQDPDNGLNLQSSSSNNNGNENNDPDSMNSTKEKRQKWSPEEDQILIKHHEEGHIDYTMLSETLLPGRTLKAISHRWNKYLKKNHTSFALRSQQSWTTEEDEIIQREIEKNFNGNLSFAAEAAKHLPGRSRDAVASRWRRILIGRGDYSYLSRPARSVWTSEEDTILLNARREHKKGYAEEAHKHLPGRTIRAITKRWQEKLSKRVRPGTGDLEDEAAPLLTAVMSSNDSSTIPTIAVTSNVVNGSSFVTSDGAGEDGGAAKRMKRGSNVNNLV